MAAAAPSFAIEPKMLAAVYAALKTIPNPKNNIPVTALYHVEAGEAGITVTATSLDIEAALTIEAKGDFPPICLPPYLIEAGASLGAAEVKFAIDDRRAVITGGRARFSAPVLPGADFPMFRPEFTSRAEIPGEALAEILSATVDAAAISEARYYLEGVFLEVEGGRLHAVATDGHRLHATSTVAPEGLAALAAGIIVPTKAAREIASVATKAEATPVVLETCERAVAVTHGGERVASKLIDGSFPDWRRVVPDVSGTAATVDLAEMIAALDRVMKMQAVNEADMKSKSKASAVRIGVDGEFLTISTARNGEIEARDAVRAEFQGAFGQHGVSAKYLRATLSTMKDRGADTITLDTPDAGSPIRIESPTDEDFLGIVMPMRV